MSLFPGNKKFKEKNILELTPYRIYTHEVAENGLVNMLVPRFHNKFLANTLGSRMKKPFIRVKFDELGSSTWLEIDGHKNVFTVCKILVDKHGEKIQPVYDRVSKFLNDLYLKHCINFNELKGE